MATWSATCSSCLARDGRTAWYSVLDAYTATSDAPNTLMPATSRASPRESELSTSSGTATRLSSNPTPCVSALASSSPGV
jgi:hypothetical protein